MRFACLTTGKYVMTATVLRPSAGNDPTPAVAGHYEYQYDEETGETTNVWVEDSDLITPGTQAEIVPCLVRGVIDGGIRVAGSTERFSEVYQNIEWAMMHFPSTFIITKRDRITNITDSKGNIVWRETASDSTPTIFNVNGVTPLLNPLTSETTEYFALLQRADVQ